MNGEDEIERERMARPIAEGIQGGTPISLRRFVGVAAVTKPGRASRSSERYRRAELCDSVWREVAGSRR
jgi:hypothetical protein